jgi:hypothetical protein
MFFRVESNHVKDPIETTCLPQIEKIESESACKWLIIQYNVPVILANVFCLKYLFI